MLDCENQPSEAYFVTHCKFIERHKLFIMCLNDNNNKKSSKLEIWSMKYQSRLAQPLELDSVEQLQQNHFELEAGDPLLAVGKSSLFSSCLSHCSLRESRLSTTALSTST